MKDIHPISSILSINYTFILKIGTNTFPLFLFRPVQEFTGANKTAQNRADPTAESSTEGSRHDDR